MRLWRKEWRGQQDAEQASGLAFYIDGHVRVYHGDQTKLPRHYVPRERFYLRATVDYWVNALDGQPFCYFNQAVDHGLVQTMRADVLPWLAANVMVPAEHQRRMAADPRVPRFTVVFDREGYSPDLFAELRQQRIAAQRVLELVDLRRPGQQQRDRERQAAQEEHHAERRQERRDAQPDDQQPVRAADDGCEQKAAEQCRP